MGRTSPRGEPCNEALRQRHVTVCGTDHLEILGDSIRDEASTSFVVTQTATGLAEQVNRWSPPAGNSEEVAGNTAHLSIQIATTQMAGDLDSFDLLLPDDIMDTVAGKQPDTGGTKLSL
ncbi:hypothetical protein D9M70_480470 [compost metagenome]